MHAKALFMLESGTTHAVVQFVWKLQKALNVSLHPRFHDLTNLDLVRRPRVASQRCEGDKAAAAVRTRVRQEGAVVMGLMER